MCWFKKTNCCCCYSKTLKPVLKLWLWKRLQEQLMNIRFTGHQELVDQYNKAGVLCQKKIWYLFYLSAFHRFNCLYFLNYLHTRWLMWWYDSSSDVLILGCLLFKSPLCILCDPFNIFLKSWLIFIKFSSRIIPFESHPSSIFLTSVGFYFKIVITQTLKWKWY